MSRTFTAQIERAVRDLETTGGGGSGDVVGPGSATSGHLAVFSGTSGKILADGGAVPEGGGGGGGLPESTGANKVLFDDGETQEWSDAPVLDTLTLGATDLEEGDAAGQLVLSSGNANTSFKLKHGAAAELGAIYWDGNNFVIGTQGAVGAGTARDTIVDSAANLIFATEGTSRWTVDDDAGHLRPWADATYDIGSATYRVNTATAKQVTLGSDQPFTDSEVLRSFTLRADDVHDHRLIIGTPSEGATTYFLEPATPTGEGEAGSGIRIIGGSGAGGGNVSIVAGDDTSAEGDSIPANVWLVGGYADHSEARGSVIVESPYLNFGTTAGETGYGLRDNDGTIEAKSSGGEWAALGGADFLAGYIAVPTEESGLDVLQLLQAANLVGATGANFGLFGGFFEGKTQASIRLYSADTDNDGSIEVTGATTFDGSVLIPAIGADTQVLFNDGGAIGASDRLFFDKISSGLSLNPVQLSGLTVVPTPGGESTEYVYNVVAELPGGRLVGAQSDTVTDGPSILDGDHFNTISWSAVPGAVTYRVYRVTGGTTVGLIAEQSDTTPVVDNGLTGDDVPPTSLPNTTGWLNASLLDIIHTLTLGGSLVSSGDTLTLGLPGSPATSQTIRPAASTGDIGASLNLYAANGFEGASDGGMVAGQAGGAIVSDAIVVSGAAFNLYGGSTSDGGGDVQFYAGSADIGDLDGGDVSFTAGSGHGTGAAGKIKLHSETVADAPITAPDFIVSGSRFRPDDTDGHSASLSARDIDGAAYVDFITVTNGNVPTCVVQATDFKSGDGTSGATTSIVIPGVVTITVKNGLITAAA